MRYVILMVMALMLAGCAGYQYGDVTSRALELQAEYCLESDPRERAVRLAVLRAAGVDVPPSGACTDILELVPEPTLGLEIDVERAEKDRARFE